MSACATSAKPASPSSHKTHYLLVLAAAVALVVAAAGWWRATRPPELRPLIRLNAELAPDMGLVSGNTGGLLAFSPDGERLVVTLRGTDGRVRLYTRLLHQDQLTPLEGTEGASTPFFSPNGRWIAFIADDKLKKVPVEGGAPVIVCAVPNLRGASWGDDGNIVFSRDAVSGLSRVSADGGTPAVLTTLRPGERTHRWPQVLPGSQAVLFSSHIGTNFYDNANIEVLSVKTGERKIVQRGGFFGRYLKLPDGSGRLVYMHQNTLYAAPFDLARLALTGTTVSVLEGVSSTASGGGDFAASQDGTFVYLQGKGQLGSWIIALADSSGKSEVIHDQRGAYFTPRFSPDGKRLAFTFSNGQAFDLWVKDLDHGATSRLSFLDGTTFWPVWTPDGRNIVFKSTSPTAPGLYWIRADGGGEPQRLTDGKQDEYPNAISPDGKRLAFAQPGQGGGLDIYTAAIEGDSAHPKLGRRELFLGTPAAEQYPAFSPDGRWLAYSSDETGVVQVYVRPFPGPGGRWQISSEGGTMPIWSRDGRELLYRTADQHLVAVSYTAKGDSFTFGTRRVWPNITVLSVGTNSTWDLAPDSRHVAFFRYPQDDDQKPPTHLTFLLNFTDELQRRTSGGK